MTTAGVHSRYDRGLADVAMTGQPVMLRLRVRRFFCGNENCPAATFAETRERFGAVHYLLAEGAGLRECARRHLDDLIAACPEMTTLATRVREFAAILTGRRGQDLPGWIATTRADALSGFESCLNGLDKDHDAAIAGLNLPYSNGPTELAPLGCCLG
jgi:transposase